MRTRASRSLLTSFALGLALAACDDGGTTDPDASVVRIKQKSCGFGQLCYEVSETPSQNSQQSARRALACSHNSDCKTGLSCVEGTCTAECNTNRDCKDGKVCRTASHGFGECVAGTGRPGIMNDEAELVMDAAAKRARACLSKESVAAGKEIRMHVNVYGDSGKVKEVVLPGSWEMTHEGACIRVAVGKAIFSTFDRKEQGFWYVLNPKGEADADAMYMPKTNPAAIAEAEPSGRVSGELEVGDDPDDAPKTGKLSVGEIKGGIAGPKRAAKACFTRVGASSGTAVTVKLTIDGSSGLVARSAAQGEHDGTPLGTCLASEMAKAVFPKFDGDQQTVSVKLRAP